jgi:hypothetical protein
MTLGSRDWVLGRFPIFVSVHLPFTRTWTYLTIEIDIEYTLNPRFKRYLALSLGVADIPAFLFFYIW